MAGGGAASARGAPVREPLIYIDSGTSHHQMPPDLLRDLGCGSAYEARVPITGVDPKSKLVATEKWSAKLPLGEERHGVIDVIQLEQVLSGPDITGSALGSSPSGG